jgi:O-antigen/teichoic acid export membrane protein
MIVPENEERPPGAASDRDALGRVLFYGVSRATVEGLLGLRGLFLAGLLGPQGFGVWALLRVAMNYASFSSLGVNRGLELEVAQARPGSGEAQEPFRTSLGFTLTVRGGLASIALIASFMAADRWLALGMRTFAAAIVTQGLLGYGLTCVRASGRLRRYAINELSLSALHLALATLLALRWGLGGAFLGYVLALLLSLTFVLPGLPLRPALSAAWLRRLLDVGFPVALTGMLATALASADRLVVGTYAGVTLLGYYAFAGSVAGLAGSFAFVIRTVVFPDVYQQARFDGTAPALQRHLAGTIHPFARIFPVFLGVLALGLGPAVSLVLPHYLAAIPAARLLIFAGVTAGFMSLGSVGVVAAGRQRVLPAYQAGILALNVGFSILALRAGLGLEGVAAGALVSRAAVGAGILAIVAAAAADRHPTRLALRALIPLAWCATSVFALSRWVPGHDLRSALLSLGLYALLVLPLLPGVVREVRALRATGPVR